MSYANRGHQDRYLASQLEILSLTLHEPFPLALTLVSMNGLHGKSRLFHTPIEVINLPFGVDENQRLSVFALGDLVQ